MARFIVPAHAVSDCALLYYVFINLRSLPGNYRDLFAPGVSACPSVAASLRATLLDPDQTHTTRGNAARLLGLYRDASDVPLLVDALEGRLATVPTPASDNSLEIRRSAADALAGYPEPDSMDALMRVLADRRQHSGLGWSAARALSAIGGPAVVPPLIAALSSPDPATVEAAIGGVVPIGASEAVPLLVELLRHRNQRPRLSAARALHQLGDPSARDAMEAALDYRLLGAALLPQQHQRDAGPLQLLMQRGPGAVRSVAGVGPRTRRASNALSSRSSGSGQARPAAAAGWR